MQIKAPIRRRPTITEKIRLLEACERSGLTRKAFAAQQGIGLSTLYQWQRQNRASASKRPARLIEVPGLFAHGPVMAPYRLHLPGGRLLEVGRGFDPDELRRLVQLLQSL